ncbi:MAG TPA: rhomboid family intramembrane serine protease [Pirellulales bacterium]|nr:rhomboid family intramembrane serine protease [Pirellulales bacterium]
MGIYDRNYYRDDESSSLLNARSVVVVLIVVNVIYFFLQNLLHSEALVRWLIVDSTLLHSPWQIWRLVTYSMVHIEPWTILWNMLGLFFFGRAVEDKYGPREFIRIYLMLAITAALVWLALYAGTGGGGALFGCFAVVLGMVVLFCLDDPKQTVIFIFVPMPAWLLGAILIGFDLVGILNGGANWITFAAHLAGALMAFIYFRTNMNLGRLFSSSGWPRLKRPTRLRLHDPEAEDRQLSRQVDAILEKISRDGESSLTKQERRTLEQASRRYQRRRQ